MKLKVKNTSTLLDILLKEGGYATSSKAREIIKNGAVWVNEVVISIPSTVVEAGSELEINPKRSKQEADHEKYLFKVLFEDDYLIAVVKPPRMKVERSMEGKPGFKEVVLTALQKEKNPVTHLFSVNYIETNATGVMLFAKNQKTAQAMQSKALIKKTWVALVEGKMPATEGKIEFSIMKQKTGKVVALERKSKLSEEAVSNYKVRKVAGAFTLIELTADEMKPKQFQAQLQLLGNPMAGEKKYGAILPFSQRNGLHLEKIFFKHPVDGKPVQITANLPQTFTRAGRYS